MGLFGALAGVVIDVVKTPVAVVRDFVPGGGGLADFEDSKTVDKLKDLGDDLGDVEEEIRKL